MTQLSSSPDWLQHDVPLAPLTTLGLGGPARYFCEARDDDTLLAALSWAEGRRVPVTVLGGGSNVVVADAGVDGLVVRLAVAGVERSAEGGLVHLTAAAGESWDELVTRTVEENLAGIECLAGIPGTVGATPVQNVGAYGQEVGEVIRRVLVHDRQHRRSLTLAGSECGFGYRNSMFRAAGGRYVVRTVTLSLRVGGTATVRYPELRRALEVGSAAPSLAQVRAAVLELRRRKSMLVDPADPNRRSAGSFFRNPVLEPAAWDALNGRVVERGVLGPHEELPHHLRADGRVKVPAAWLIEAAGFPKGLRRGPVGLSTGHVLALVHHGGGTTRQLLELAQEIQDSVRRQFAVSLDLEPVLIGG